MKVFRANVAAAAEVPELNSFVVLLAQEADDSGMRLELQKALSFDEQDRRLGQDTYYLVTDEGATCYGGVVMWSLADDVLNIRLDARACKTLGVEDGFVVHFASEDLPKLKYGFERIFGQA